MTRPARRITLLAVLVAAAVATVLGTARLRASRPESGDEMPEASARQGGRTQSGALAAPASSEARAKSESGGVAEEKFEPPEPSSDRVSWKQEVVVTVVADDTGAPVEGARVRSLVTWRPEDFRETTTDAAGRAQVAVPDRGLGLWVRKRGFVVALAERDQTDDMMVTCVEPPPSLEKDGRVTIRLQRGAPMSGRVVRAGSDAPVADAEVYVWNTVTEKEVECRPEQLGGLREGGLVTDGDGRFDVAGVPPSTPLVIAARAAGLGATVLRRPADAAGDVVFALGAGGSLAGTVTLDGAGPAARARVYAVLAGDSFGRTNPDSRWLAGGEVRFPALAVTDASGRYRIDGLAVPARYEVVASGAEYAQGGSEPATLRAAGETATRDVAMVTPAWIRARGVAPDESKVGIEDLNLVQRDGSPIEDRYWSGGGSYGGESDEGSLFTRPPGHWLLLARGHGDFAPASIPIDLAPGEHKVLEIRFAPGLSLRGRVVSEDGVPLGSIDVETGDRTSHRSTQTDADGGFVLAGLAEGELTLDVGRGEPYVEPTTVRTRCPSTEPVVVRLVSRPSVVGRVQRIHVATKELSGCLLTPTWRRRIWPRVEADGTFRVPHVPAGEAFDLALFDKDEGGWTRTGLLVERGARADLGTVVFEPARILRGFVHDENRAPIPNALVTADDEWGPVETRTDAGGHFQFDSAPAFPFTLVARAPGHADGFARAVGNAGPGIRCPSGVLVRGDLLSADQEAVTGRALRLVPSASSDDIDRFYATGTDTLGQFEVRVPPGSYDVYTVEFGDEDRHERARHTRDRLVDRIGHVDVDGGSEARVTLRLSTR